ncbi:MAG: NAD+ synthetase, partial [Planctomycetia bacterium]|nr:NAD+ synthetase [Planctomycetia bacterium]
TAELRPSEAHQTDESDLMPYVVLNMFETALIRDRLSPEAALTRVENEGRSQGFLFSHEEYTAWFKKFLRRWNVSQWKRERGAAGFHLDRYDLSPGSWCRFPILSGGLQ